MRKILGSFVEGLCRMRLRRRLGGYGVIGPGTSLDQLTLALDSMPGMMSPEAGPMLFTLSATQRIRGDTIEVGSWQGRSTIFLAKGAQVGGNGRVFAVDHFHGNPGKERLYRISRDDLADVPEAFKRNVTAFNVAETVELLAMPSHAAAANLAGKKIRARLLFIDGDHEYEAVLADFVAFQPLLLPNALVVFDDFSMTFPGVTRCVEELVDSVVLKPLFCYGNCFIGEFVGA